MSNPFIIKIPEGATEIDLGPILRPLIYALADGIIGHKDAVRSGGDSLDGIDRFAEDAINDLHLRYLVQKITRPILISFLKQDGWAPEDDRESRFWREYDIKRRSWDRYGPSIYSGFDNNWGISYAMDAVRGLSNHHRLIPPVEMAQKILDSVNVLDRIVHELESDS